MGFWEKKRCHHIHEHVLRDAGFFDQKRTESQFFMGFAAPKILTGKSLVHSICKENHELKMFGSQFSEKFRYMVRRLYTKD